jgi:hypothetical protein
MRKKGDKHKGVLNQILKDTRLSPNRRLLAELLRLWLDSEDTNEKAILLQIIVANYGSSQRPFWLDKTEDGKPKTFPVNSMDVKAADALRKYFEAMEQGQEPPEIDSSILEG